jgi:hypothetical protein
MRENYRMRAGCTTLTMSTVHPEVHRAASETDGADKLAHAPPAWLTPARVVLATLLWWQVLGGAVLAYVYLAAAERSADAIRIATGVASAALWLLAIAYPVARWFTRARTPKQAFMRAFAGAYGRFLVLWGLHAWYQSQEGRHANWELPVDLPTAAVACLVVAAFSAVWQGQLWSNALDFRLRAPPHDTAYRTLGVCATWSAVGVALNAIISLCVSNESAARACMLWTAFVCGPLLGLRAIAQLRIRARRRWLSRVRLGEVQGWRVTDARGTTWIPDFESNGLPISLEQRQLLVRTQEANDPYRGVREEIAVAELVRFHATPR